MTAGLWLGAAEEASVMVERRPYSWSWHIFMIRAWATAVIVLLASVASVSAVEVAPSVNVDPSSAAAGVQVVATASGFEGCAVSIPIPEEATAPPVVGLRMIAPHAIWMAGMLPLVETTEPGSVRFAWDGEQVDEVAMSDGGAVGVFTIPPDAPVGNHMVSAVCAPNAAIAARTPVVVEPPEETPTIVPPLTGLTVAAAEERLKEAELNLGDVTVLDGEQIASQEPEAGTEAERGSIVNVVVGEAPPTLVDVPVLDGLERQEAQSRLQAVGLVLGNVTGAGVVDTQSHAPGTPVPVGTAIDVFLTSSGLVTVPQLVGLQLSEASEILTDRELVLGQVSGDDPQAGDVVRMQRPTAGVRVESGSAITVSIEPGEPPEALVVVPRIVGGTVGEARAALDAVGLRPTGSAEQDATVGAQSPEPGVLVPRGTPVTMTVTQPASSSFFAPTLLWGVLLIAGAAVTASLLARLALRRGRGHRWAGRHVRVAAGSSPPPTHTTEESAEHPAMQTRAIRLEPRCDSGTHLVKEVVDR